MVSAPRQPTEDAGQDLIEAGRRFFAQPCDFIAGAASLDGMPSPGASEIAFAGRSNVGKSSLINALTFRRSLARVSRTPGRTQQINFFTLAQDRLRIVDLPGYGYAKVSKTQVAGWTDLIKAYLRGRTTLVRVCLLIDARHGIKTTDDPILSLLDKAAVPYRVVLTKCDEVKAPALEATIDTVRARLRKHPAALPEPIATSSVGEVGLEELRADLVEIAGALDAPRVKD